MRSAAWPSVMLFATTTQFDDVMSDAAGSVQIQVRGATRRDNLEGNKIFILG